jgi:hypothetical protein
MNMPHMKPNVIGIDGGAIVIQSCDDTTANVGIFANGRNAYHHVSIYGLEREWKPVKPSDMPTAEYDRILNEHKSEFLETVNNLCLPKETTHHDHPTFNL